MHFPISLLDFLVHLGHKWCNRWWHWADNSTFAHTGEEQKKQLGKGEDSPVHPLLLMNSIQKG